VFDALVCFTDRMDRVFVKGSVVEALDTTTGKWQPAWVTAVSRQTVSLHFPNFAKELSQMTEHVGEEHLRYTSKWPVRHPTPPVVQTGPTKRRLPRVASLYKYDPTTKAVGDVVSIIVWGYRRILSCLTYLCFAGLVPCSTRGGCAGAQGRAERPVPAYHDGCRGRPPVPLPGGIQTGSSTAAGRAPHPHRHPIRPADRSGGRCREAGA
jgi:hypothetical protein